MNANFRTENMTSGTAYPMPPETVGTEPVIVDLYNLAGSKAQVICVDDGDTVTPVPVEGETIIQRSVQYAFTPEQHERLIKSSGPSWLAAFFPIRVESDGSLPSDQLTCLDDPEYETLCSRVLYYFKKLCFVHKLSPARDLEAYHEAMHIDETRSETLRKQFVEWLKQDPAACFALEHYGLLDVLRS